MTDFVYAQWEKYDQAEKYVPVLFLDYAGYLFQRALSL